ncbi:MAG: 30S ribosomal protein S6 [Ruminococcus sp.]|jgi:small subunit ribosomal protein S6|nr:30S ribosomal protein S6 [Ruminococcus sp.]
MAKITEKYEAMVVYTLKNAEEGAKELDQKFRDLITANSENLKADVWGKRRLAYEIDDQREGYYMLYTFEAKPTFPIEFERILKITEGVMRYMVTVFPIVPEKYSKPAKPAPAPTAEPAE